MYKFIAFDFDGTLADSVDFCLLVFDTVLKKYMGDRAPTREDIYQNFGMNEPGVLRHYIGYENKDAENDFYAMHREQHNKLCPAPFAGCKELLEFLKLNNISLGIITGRSETTCSISMELLGLGKYFRRFFYGSPERNDKTAQLLQLMQEEGLKADELIYIGDAVSDAAASHRADVRCLSAAWAKSARIEELEKINPGFVFRSVADMQKHIAGNI